MFSWLVDINYGLIENIRDMFTAIEHGMVVRADMRQLAQAVRAYYHQREELPVQNLRHVLLAYLRYHDEEISRDTGRDAWGTLYRLQPEENGFSIISAGRDRRWNSNDDIIRNFRFQP